MPLFHFRWHQEDWGIHGKEESYVLHGCFFACLHVTSLASRGGPYTCTIASSNRLFANRIRSGGSFGMSFQKKTSFHNMIHSARLLMMWWISCRRRTHIIWCLRVVHSVIGTPSCRTALWVHWVKLWLPFLLHKHVLKEFSAVPAGRRLTVRTCRHKIWHARYSFFTISKMKHHTFSGCNPGEFQGVEVPPIIRA